MIHPLLRLIATKPQLLADHVEAYAELAGEEFESVANTWKLRALLYAIAVASASVAIVLIGVALLVWGAGSHGDMRAPWVLWLVPGVPVVLAIICVVASRREGDAAFVDLRQQLAADLSLLREASAS